MGREARKGYLGNYAPPFGGGVGGEAVISLSFYAPPFGGGEGGGVHIKPSTDSHTILHIAVSSTDVGEACLSKGIVRNIVQCL